MKDTGEQRSWEEDIFSAMVVIGGVAMFMAWDWTNMEAELKEIASGLVKLLECVGRAFEFLRMPAGEGDVLIRFGFGGETAVVEPMAESWDLILGRSRGPWVRIGDRAGVVMRVLQALSVVKESEGDESKE